MLYELYLSKKKTIKECGIGYCVHWEALFTSIELNVFKKIFFWLKNSIYFLLNENFFKFYSALQFSQVSQHDFI